MLLYQNCPSTTLSSSFLSRGEGGLSDSFNDIIDRAVSDAKDICSFANDGVTNYSSTKSCDAPSSWLLPHIAVEDTARNDSVYPYVHERCDDTIHNMMEPTPIGSNIHIVESFENEHGDLTMNSWRKFLETLNQGNDIPSERLGLSDSCEAILPSKRHQELNISDHDMRAPPKRQKMMTSPGRLNTRLDAVSPLPSGLFYCSTDELVTDVVKAPTSAASTVAVTPKKHLRECHIDNWEAHYEKMVAFRAEHGHCFVPYNFPQNPKLSMWVKRQRYQYKLKQQGRHHTLTNDRLMKLDALGFIYDSHKAIWEERYSELVQYRKAFGRTDVPFQFHNKKLAIWVKCQRRQYRLRLQDKPSSITPERIAKLNQIDFEWKCQQA